MNKGPSSEKIKKTVLICHYRVGWTDGVSLEIEKRVHVLEEMGWDVKLLAGKNSKGADFIIDELDFDLPEIRKITDNAFNQLSDYQSEEELLDHISNYALVIKRKLDKILDKLNPDFILLHNIFSHGRHIACAKSFYDVLQEREIPSLATHHDFYWEREHLAIPTGKKIESFLKKYVPPVIPGLRHAVINSLTAKKLLNKTGITSVVIPDTLNFDKSPWLKDEYNNDLIKDFGLNPNDIFILQATRIVIRKGIELIPPIISKLNSAEYLKRLVGKRLYNGKLINENSRFVFLLAGYAEGEAAGYLNYLQNQMKEEKIPYRFLESKIVAERSESNEGKKYSLFDTYPHADIVSYPSQFEGWGNQFLEALFAKKPVIVFEYPVFKEDIKSFGYNYISLGDQVDKDSDTGFVSLDEDKQKEICNLIINTLISSETVNKLEENYQIGMKNNSHTFLSKLMEGSMVHYEE